MAQYTKVNRTTCIACGSCNPNAPDLFNYTADGYAFCTLDDNKGCTAVPDDFLDDLEDAVEGCPSGSILVSDSPFD
ncbi:MULTISPECIES: ferredoxin [unclassified Lysinibacillus]|uniref:ferredoxin n=1 Tax=unclassified Lysinibacillus TaxID=2636778 RepID=UPI0020111B48|nr:MULTISPECIES: ferredoxin [unclassified Lysinibacillus]MCL1696707.1 ferredoxin [Lysinibacillus sp. BPa_S21]MCL1698812.1 ferredoxin [Lysinibacillus sp. Bpr_S20]